jgi:acetyl/propionyl-CoA carboxylase alpha subunit
MTVPAPELRDINRLAVVNRGEPALRLLHAVRAYNRASGTAIETVVLLTRADADSVVAHEADRVAFLPIPEGRSAAAAYLDAAAVMRTIRELRADAVWVGWGFLAESPAFAQAVEAAGVLFIGPTPEAMDLAGDKIRAKLLAAASGVPVVPWSGAPVPDLPSAHAHAHRIGFPVIVKAAAGGGGRGIRVAKTAADLDEAFTSARLEAARSFGDDAVFIEACVQRARHLEAQVAADVYGRVVAYGVRDCSLQRRHQKVIEEAPGPVTTAALAEALERHAITFARAAGYRNVGTVEFIHDLDRDAVFFMEMNARLQVEHTITEEVYGVDLVKLQLDLARGAALEDPPAPRGYAIEARLNAEDGERDDAPAPGRVLRFHAPRGPGVRVDAGVIEGGTIPADFDSMVAKIIARGRDRNEAIARLRGALDDLAVLVEDGATNKALLVNTLAHPDFAAGDVDTGWLDRTRKAGGLSGLDTTAEALIVAAVLSYREAHDAAFRAFYDAVERGVPQKLPASTGRTYRLGLRGHRYTVDVFQLGPDRHRVYLDGSATDLGLEDTGRGSARLVLDDLRLKVLYDLGPRAIFVEVEGVGARIAKDSGGGVTAPAPAMIISVDVAVGDVVVAGQRLATLESMKMEIPLRAPEPGRVQALLVEANQTVAKGDPVVTLAPLDDGTDHAALDAHLRVAAPATADPFATLFDHEGRLLQRSIDALSESRINPVRNAIFAVLRRTLMGWDIDLPRASRLDHLLATRTLWDGPLLAGDPEALIEALCGFADLEWALSRRHLRGLDARPAISMHTAFFQYARAIERGEDTLREDYKAHLLRALRAMGVADLTPTPALREAVCRIAIAHDRTGPRPGLRFALVSSLVQLLAHLAEAGRGAVMSGNRRLERALGQLRALDEDRWLTLSDHAAQAHHVIFQKPRFGERASVLSRFLEDVLDRAHDEALRADATVALVEASVALSSPLVKAACVRQGPSRRAAAEAVLRRIYNDRDLFDVAPQDLGELFVLRARTTEPEAERSLALVVAPVAAVERAVAWAAEHARDARVVDVVAWTDHAEASPDRAFARFAVACDAAPWAAEVTRATLTVASESFPLRSVTLTRGGDGALTIDPGPRDLHPVQARHLEIERLASFALTRLPSHEGLCVYRGTAHDNADDVRIFVLAETRDVHAGDVLEPAPASLFTFEHAMREAVQALRQVQSERGETRSRYHWNQIILLARPAVSVTREAILEHVSIMPVDFRALGLDRFVMRGRLVDPSAGGGPPVPMELTISNASRHHSEVRFEPATRAPVPTASRYDLKVQRTRRFDVTYPYEIIHLLTAPQGPEVASRRPFPPGEFEEYDLEPTADGALLPVPVTRPPGSNRAGIVFGLVRHFTAKHPEGMERVLVLSDPLMGLGALAEAECRRILAALDLAEVRGVPLEWVPISSGARIAMDTGTENLDWTARVLRRVITFTQAGGVIHVIVDGLNVGAQSYFNAEATMLMHTRGALIMTRRGSMVLTGKRALDFSGSVSAADELGIGGFERIMGPNGQAQYLADNLGQAYEILFELYRFTYVAPAERRASTRRTGTRWRRSTRGRPRTASRRWATSSVTRTTASGNAPSTCGWCSTRWSTTTAGGSSAGPRPTTPRPPSPGIATSAASRSASSASRAGRCCDTGACPETGRSPGPRGRCFRSRRRRSRAASTPPAAAGRWWCSRTCPASTAPPSRCGACSSSTAPRSGAPW